MSLLRNKPLWTVNVGHFAVDLFSGLTPVLLTALSVPLQLSNTQIGLAAAVYTVGSSLSQPLFGHLADRFGARWLGSASLVWAATFMILTGRTTAFVPLMILLGLASLGVGAYHPQGAMKAAESTPTKKSTAVSLFFLSGNGGRSTGALVGGLLFAWMGTSGISWVGLPVLLAAGLVWVATPATHHNPEPTARRVSTAPTSRNGQWLLLGTLITLVALRSWAGSSTETYLPKLLQERGLPSTIYGSVLSLNLLAFAIGNIAGGFLADQWATKPIITGSLILTAPALFLMATLDGLWIPIMGVLVGLLVGLSFSLTVVIGQELMPNNQALASGLVLGLAFITGGIGTSFTGLLADQVGLATALRWTAIALPVAVLCSLALPAGRPRLEPAPEIDVTLMER